MSKRPFIQNQYFQDTLLAQWSFDSYLDYTNKRQSRKSKNIALLDNFHNQLINMKEKKNLANNVKVHIENILSKDQEAQASSSTIAVINISGQGSSLIHNSDNYNGTTYKSSNSSINRRSSKNSSSARSRSHSHCSNRSSSRSSSRRSRRRRSSSSSRRSSSSRAHQNDASQRIQSSSSIQRPSSSDRALSSILLVRPGRIHNDLYTTFGTAGIHELQDYLKEDFQFGKYGKLFDKNLFNELKKIAENANECASTIILSVAQLLSTLPKDERMDEIQAQELCTRYLNAALSSLFENPEKGYFFRWISTNSMDAPTAPLH
ncbi:hypothetical protein BDC45DRAFT_575544 [Circinella umbellata]|nr:hypothetical protein BDC45DRAFT_575544 [Circinella umbellata]